MREEHITLYMRYIVTHYYYHYYYLLIYYQSMVVASEMRNSERFTMDCFQVTK